MRLLRQRWNAAAERLFNPICLLVISFVVAAASFNGYYTKWHFLETRQGYPTSGHATFEQLVDGTAWRPFIYRQMIPILANGIDRHVSDRLEDELLTQSPSYASFRHDALNSPMAENRTYFVRFLVVYFTDFFFAWASLIAMYFLCLALGFSRAGSALASAAFLLLMPFLQTVGGYMYDYPELFFFTLAAWLALRLDWWCLIPIAALATLNKESFLLYIPTLYPLLRLHASRLKATMAIGTLAITSGIVYAFLRIRFRGNPGVTVEWHLIDHLRFLFYPKSLIYPFKTTYGWLLPPTSNPVFWVIVVWAVWRGWRFLPSYMRRFAKIAAAINVPLYLLFCADGELRDLSMLFVPFLALIAVNFEHWVKGGKAGGEAIVANG